MKIFKMISSAISSAIGVKGAASPANVVQIGGRASASPATAVAEGAVTPLATWLDSRIKQVGDNIVDDVKDVRIGNWPQDTPTVYSAIDSVFNSATAVTSSEIDISTSKRVGIIIKSAITRDGATPTLVYTITVAAAVGGTYVPFDIIMSNAGTDAPVANVSHGSASTTTLYFVGYLPEGFTAGGLKVTATPTDCDANDTVDSDVWIVVQK